MNLELVKKQALLELEEEQFREEVEKYKTKLREHRSIWDKLFPYKILIIKKGEV